MVLLPIRSHHNLVVASWDELYYALLIPVRVLSFQLSCYSCFQLATIVKFLAAKIFASALATDLVADIKRRTCRLRAFENRVLTRIFGPRRDEVTWEWRNLHNEELNELFS